MTISKMNNPKRSETIKKFLELNTHEELANQYNSNMEVQVLVKQVDGEPVENEFKGRFSRSYSNGVQLWYPFRIPQNADSDPINNDSEMTYNLSDYALGIGMTGWDYVNKKSIYVGFDFDAMIGHSPKHSNKLTTNELYELEEAVSNIPWVTVRYSTSGMGRHIYVYVNEVETTNHNEHSALSRAILGIMAGLTNFDFYSKVDVYGSNMWVWHEKMINTNGLKLIKKGSILQDIPNNWRDHISVVSGKRKKSIPTFVPSELQDEFLELVGQKSRIPFDADHKKLINYLNDNRKYCSYDADHHLIITHTAALKEAFDILKLKGVFETLATGKDEGDLNCWMYPMHYGAWAIRRYTKGIQEAPTWTHDPNGWTKCYLNKIPDLKTAARICNGLEDTPSGFVFPTAKDAQQAAAMLNINIDIPEWAQYKKTKLNEHKDSRLIVELDYDPNGDFIQGGLKGWLQKGKSWKKIFDTPISDISEIEASNFDDIVRHLLTPKNDDAGWTVKTRNGWQNEPINHVTKVLKNNGFKTPETEIILGSCIQKAWRLVNIPFQPEYPGNRQWNRNAAQLRYTPSNNKNYSTWDKLFEHLGKNLDDALINNKWAKENAIKKGADYLKLWVASLLQHPEEPLPYLFLYGPEDCGKSSLHEALSLLILNGVQRADTALTNQSSFNAELENAILCCIEETDLRKNKNALNLIRDWLIAPTITIHRKGETPYDTLNYMHFIQTANDSKFCPVISGDTRITMILINPLEEKIAKRELFRQLDKEAPDFLYEMLNIEIPYNEDRLAIPVITTDVKLQAQSANKNEIELFIEAMCFEIDGAMIKFSEFYNRFTEWLDPNELHNWSKIKVGRSIPPQYPYGRNFKDGSQFYIGNLSFENGEHKSRIVHKNGQLVSLAEVQS